MDTELALLKQRADQADQRLGRMEGKLDQIGETLRSLATKEDVKRAESAAWNALGVGGGVALALVALLVGVLTYLQDQRIATRPDPAPVQTAAPAPVIIQMPPWPTAPPPAALAPTPPQP